MTTMPQIEILAETTDPSALMRLGANIQPHLVLLDASAPEDEAWSAVRRIKEEWSRTRCMVFVEDSQGQRRAQAAGADVALLKGHRATKLIEAIEELLS
jgi:DNA-binding NarL/FixJ family response regulator